MENSDLPIRLIDLPGIAEVEKIASMRGANWREDDPERVALTDRVSVSLFGITEADTVRPEPQIEDYLTPKDRATVARYWSQSLSSYRYALDAMDKGQSEWLAWEDNFRILYDADIADDDIDVFWRLLGIDTTKDDGEELACLHSFSRQLIVAARGLLPGAIFTPDGSGTRASPDADTWGKALEASAKAFEQRKRK